MEPTSIDVLAVLEGSTAPDLGGLSSPDGALTLLFCEIANIGAIRRSSTPEGVASLLDDQRMIVQRIVSSHRAEQARAHEDGYMIVSDSAHAALRCAMDLQRSFVAPELDQHGPSIQLRVGLHTGPVITGEDDLYGRTVLLGARIAGLAGGGEILVSAKTREYTETDPSFEFVAHGEHHFKGLHGEHELFALVWDRPAPERELPY